MTTPSAHRRAAARPPARRWVHCLAWIASLALVPACVHPIEEERSAIGELTGDCIVPPPADVVALPAPVSLEYPDGSLWIWEGLELEDGRRVSNAAAFVSGVDDVCGGGPELITDAAGAPVTLLSLSAAEVAENEARADGKQLVLVPTGGFVHDGAGYLFYDHVLVGPGLFDAEPLGAGLCVRAAGAPTCERILAAADTLLWQPGERFLNRGGLVAGDRALVYGCRQVAEFTAVCTVAGAPLDRLTDPSAYQVFSALSGWVDDIAAAAAIADELGPLTISSYEGAFLATALDIFESRFYVRRAPSATSALDRRIALFDAAAPEPSALPFLGGGREHAGLRREPMTLHVSYSTDNRSAPGLHLATFRFFGEFGGQYQ